MQKYILLSIFLLSFYTSYAQDSVIVLKDKSSLKMIGKQIYFFEDETSQLSFEAIQKPENQQKFLKYDKNVFSSPASQSAVWFKIILQNQTGEDIWLETGGSFACWYIDFYRPDSLGRYGKPVETGALRPEANKEYPVNFYWLKLANAQNKAPQVYYMRMKSGFTKEYPLQVGTLAQLYKNKDGYDYLIAGFVGLTLIMIFYNLFLYTATKDKIYLIYGIYLITAGVDIIFDNNYPFSMKYYWWEYMLVWHNLTIFFIVLFATQYLNLSKNAPRLNKFIWGSNIFLSIIIPLFNLLGVPIDTLFNILQIGLVILFVTLIYIGIYLWAKGYKNARFYVLGWSFAIVSIVAFMLVINGVLPFNLYTRNAMCFGFSLEILMFSLALGDRLNIMRDEKEKAQQEALQRSQENEKIVKNQNSILEQKVVERTQTLKIQNEEIQQQKEELQQQKEELTAINETLESTYSHLKRTSDRLNSSIQYAKNVQEVILPEPVKLLHFFADYFALYLPKDIVGGDFYWFSQLDTNRAIFVLADCTGHGVPGAFMTMVGNTLLHEIVNVKNIHQPDLVLPELHEEITFLLKQDQGKNMDGMDVSVCLIEKEEHKAKVTFAGAKTKMYYTLGNGELVEVVGDKEFIGAGGNIGSQKLFTSHPFYINLGDVLYLTSDGYVDQNNKDRKRFGSSKFKELLLAITSKSLEEQQKVLHQTLLVHQNGEEQRDDITVIGLKM